MLSKCRLNAHTVSECLDPPVSTGTYFVTKKSLSKSLEILLNGVIKSTLIMNSKVYMSIYQKF